MADRQIAHLITSRTEANLWKKVDRRGPDDCWNWTATKDRRGYGQMMMRDHFPARATHIVLTLDGRPRPGNLHALHSCDNPSCCNPRHLRWGTIAENAQEKASKGRCPDTGGIRNAHAKLTEEDVRTIRASTEAQRALGAHYGVSHTVIGRIKRCEKWRSLD